MADFCANWSAIDQPVFPYNSGTEARIEAPQAHIIIITLQEQQKKRKREMKTDNKPEGHAIKHELHARVNE